MINSIKKTYEEWIEKKSKCIKEKSTRLSNCDGSFDNSFNVSNISSKYNGLTKSKKNIIFNRLYKKNIGNIKIQKLIKNHFTSISPLPKSPKFASLSFDKTLKESIKKNNHTPSLTPKKEKEKEKDKDKDKDKENNENNNVFSTNTSTIKSINKAKRRRTKYKKSNSPKIQTLEDKIELINKYKKRKTNSMENDDNHVLFSNNLVYKSKFEKQILNQSNLIY